MRKTIFITAILALTFVFFSCNKDKDKQQQGATKEASIDASSNIVWQYYSFSEERIVGSAEESEENNTEWAARKDWDIAIRRYFIRTNSGEFTSTAAQGGVYTCDAQITFASIESLPKNIQFAEDKSITTTGMNGVTTTVIHSDATVILFKKNEDGTMVMPPVYLPAPVYIFRTADGKNYHKVEFTQYKNEDDATGHVKFNYAKTYKN